MLIGLVDSLLVLVRRGMLMSWDDMSSRMATRVRGDRQWPHGSYGSVHGGFVWFQAI